MESDLSALERLVGAWRQRAESLREGASEAPTAAARAEAFDTCAAQLAQVLTALGIPLAPGQDRESLNLFK